MFRLLLFIIPFWILFYIGISNWKKWELSTAKKLAISLGYATLASLAVAALGLIVVSFG